MSTDSNPSTLAHLNIKQLSVISFRFVVLWIIQTVVTITGLAIILLGALFDFPYVFLTTLFIVAIVFCVTIPYNLILINRYRRVKNQCYYYTSNKGQQHG